MITCKSGMTIRTSIADIREAGRATQGVKLINLQTNDSIAAITKLDEMEEENPESIENPESPETPAAGETTEPVENPSE
jgi:DNA gyrase subunit A